MKLTNSRHTHYAATQYDIIQESFVYFQYDPFLGFLRVSFVLYICSHFKWNFLHRMDEYSVLLSISKHWMDVIVISARAFAFETTMIDMFEGNKTPCKYNISTIMDIWRGLIDFCSCQNPYFPLVSLVKYSSDKSFPLCF